MAGRSDDRGSTNWIARLLALLVLVAVGVAIVLVVSDSLSGGDSSGESSQRTRQAQSRCPGGDEQAVKDGYYVVREGDNFTTIAQRTCVSEERLQRLNPNLDPFGLQVQNCVDLVPDGCRKLAEGG